MQPPPDGSYPGSQDGQPGGDPNAGQPYQGGGYGYPQTPPPQNYQNPPSYQGPPNYQNPQGYQGYQGGYPQQGGYGGYQPPPPPPRGVASRGWFWITLAAVVVIAAAVISTLVITSGDGGGTSAAGDSTPPTGNTTSTGDTSSTDTTSSSPTPTDTTSSASTSSTSSSASSGGGEVGRTYDVNGDLDGQKLAVTLLGVDQNARPNDDYDKPDAGHHFVATEYRVHNIGSAKYDDAIDNCVTVLDARKAEYKIQIVQGISSGTVIDNVDLAPGQTAEGWLVYSVPTGTSIASTTFTPNSGFADTTLTWTVG